MEKAGPDISNETRDNLEVFGIGEVPPEQDFEQEIRNYISRDGHISNNERAALRIAYLNSDPVLLRAEAEKLVDLASQIEGSEAASLAYGNITRYRDYANLLMARADQIERGGWTEMEPEKILPQARELYQGLVVESVAYSEIIGRELTRISLFRRDEAACLRDAILRHKSNGAEPALLVGFLERLEGVSAKEKFGALAADYLKAAEKSRKRAQQLAGNNVDRRNDRAIVEEKEFERELWENYIIFNAAKRVLEANE